MKYLVLCFCLFWFVTVNSQTSKVDNDTVGKGLSESEFIAAKQAYSKMLETEDYILWKKNIRTIAVKENGLAVPNTSEDSKWLTDTVYSKKWLADNIKKTKFRSVDEAFNAYSESYRLTKKLKEEHFDVYKEIAKANKGQRKEIFEMDLKHRKENNY